MLINQLTEILESSSCLDAFWSKLDAGEDASLGIASSARPFMVAARFAHKPQPTLVVVAGKDQATTFANSVASYLGDDKVIIYPDREDTPFNEKKRSVKDVARRMEAAYDLYTNEKLVVVASARALMRCLPPASEKVCAPLVFQAGLELADMPQPKKRFLESFEDLPLRLEDMGFQNTGELDGPGTFAIHGGVIDIYPGNVPYPVRLDFFGDELDEIRRIVPTTGQTISNLDTVSIFPVVEYSCAHIVQKKTKDKLARPARTNPALREMLEDLEGGLRFEDASALLPYIYHKTVTLGAYTTDQTLSVLIEPRSLFDDASHAFDEISQAAHGSNIGLDGLFTEPTKIDFGGHERATYLSIMRVGANLDAEIPVKRVEVAGHPDKLFQRMHSLVDARYTIIFSATNYRAREDIKLAFVDYDLPIQDLTQKNRSSDNESSDPKLRRGIINIVDNQIPLGMIVPKAKLALISLSDTQGAQSSNYRKSVDITQITFPYKPGDYVVHAAHGVALFKNLVRRELEGTERDYLLLEYAENDKLYVPVEQLDRVTKYVGPEGASPRLTRLNTSDWSRAMAKARKATKKLAFDLVDIYTRRATVQGYKFSEDTLWQKEMEDAFPYDETPDQLAAIADVKKDMQSSKPMDRLICGDVGFGKTEVALRAAFKATQDHKQVMVLCPTTILAQQHFITFKERCEPFGVSVEVLSRFRSPAEQKKTLEEFASGDLDILVGTHRLLSRDVNPHDLGLVIIDEEQRFGVGHKEQLKNLREYIDVLALSATPIPRTMQMSLSGVRDVSLILTPPSERRPVEVHVGEWDPDVVSQAIRRELARKGQVYYVSNRVKTIEDAVARVGAAVGEARIGLAHGQMDKDELERIMEDFAAGEFDVLVATTIIESGIDNPHTNTLIIEDSQRLGLAQMYQLKGRVGRSAVQAYAYFMFPERVPLTQEAIARLEALNEFQDLGSGIRIAMRDLEIRGAGNLLGAEQSGNMSAVGFDLFAQMLASAVNATREGNLKALDELPAALSDITVNIPGHTYIPEEYIPDADERVLWYRRLASASTEAAVDELYSEMLSSRPEMPQATRNLFNKARIKALAHDHHIRLISVVSGRLVVEPIEIPSRVMTKLRRAGGRYLVDKRKLRLPLRYFAVEKDDDLLEPVYRFLKDLVEKPEDSEVSAI